MASRHQSMNWRDSIWVQTQSRSGRSRCVKATQRLVPYSENKGYASNPRCFQLALVDTWPDCCYLQLHIQSVCFFIKYFFI